MREFYFTTVRFAFFYDTYNSYEGALRLFKEANPGSQIERIEHQVSTKVTGQYNNKEEVMLSLLITHIPAPK